MESLADNAPLIVVVGPTASGKTALALNLAERFGGEIIAADSRTIYKGMDIGTAKPTSAERQRVPHHLLDIIEPDAPFTVVDFQRLANAAISEIIGRGKLPILVGGSGLYIDAVIYNFSFRGAPDAQLRQQTAALSVEEVQRLLESRNITLPADERNPRHLVRALETGGTHPSRGRLRPHTLVIGLDPGKEVLAAAIVRRVEQMVTAGFVDEVRTLATRYGWAGQALQAPGYKAFRPYLAGVVSLDEAKELFVRYDVQYAKRQKTWFKRNADIRWISNPAEAVDIVTTFLNK
jgi:tRNA dimethylallyltransferase